MKRINLYLLAVVAILLPGLLTSCSGDSGVEALLETVPSEAPGVLVINVDKSTENLGLTKGGLDNLFKENFGDRGANQLNRLMDPKNGLDASTFVIYLYGNTHVATANVTNEKALKSLLNEMLDGDIRWSKDGKVSYDRDNGIVITENQVWFCCARSAVFDKLKYITSDKGDGSFLAEHKGAADVLNLDAEASAVVDIKGLCNWMSKLDAYEYSQLATSLSMISGMMGSDVKYIGGVCEVDKDEIDLSLRVYDSKGKPVTSDFDTSAIDPAVLSNHLGNNDFVVALSIDNKLINQILNQLGAFVGGSDMQMIKSLLGDIDGTCAYSFSPNNPESFSAVVTTTSGNAASALCDNVEQLMDGMHMSIPLTVDGKFLCANTESNGNLPASVANLMKGKMIAAYINLSNQVSGCDYVLIAFDSKEVKYEAKLKLKKGSSFADVLNNLNR